MRPPLVQNKISDSQQKSILNHRGQRNVKFSNGENVLIRNYKNPNKPSWSKATIKQQLGPRSYYCILKHNNKIIKRHLDQIRDIESPQSDQGCHDTHTSVVADKTSDNIVDSGAEQPRLGLEEAYTDDDVRQLRPRHKGKVVKPNT